MIASPIVARRLVGRAKEQAFLGPLLDDAANGRGAVVVLTGEAGTGKTRLLHSWQQAARERGGRTAYAAADDYAAAAFAPLTTIMRELIGRDRRFRPAEPEARAIFDRFVDRLAPADGDAEPWQRRRTFVVIASVLERIAAKPPVMIAVDDVMLADPESLELLRFLAPLCASNGIIFACAARSDEFGLAPATYDALISLERHPWSYRVVLGALTRDETRDLIFSALPPQRSLVARTVDEICRRSGGNPLFAESLVRDALFSGDAGSPNLPQTVEQSIRRRLDELSLEHVRIVEIASALGPTFLVATVAGVAEVALDVAAQAMRAARRLSLIDEIGTDGTLRFHHDLIRTAIEERMLLAERRALHQRVAVWLERNEPTASDATLALHWRNAGDHARAANHAVRAGRSLLRENAFAGAREQFEYALESELAPATRAELLESLGTIGDLLGSAATARQRFDEALALARAIGTAADVSRLALSAANAAYRSTDIEAAIAYARDALTSAGGDDRMRYPALVTLATLFAYSGDVDAARLHLELADAAPGPHAAATIVRHYAAWATVHALRDDLVAWRSASERFIEIAEECGDPAVAANSWINLAGFAGDSAEFALADRGFRRAIELSDSYALTYSSAYARIAAAELAELRGDLARAHALIESACALAVDTMVVRFYLGAVGLSVALHIGDADLAARLEDPELLEAAFASRQQGKFAPLAAAHARLLRRRGDIPAAQALVERTIGLLEDASYADTPLLAFALIGDRRAAERAASLLAAAPRRRPCTAVYLALANAMAGQRRGDDAARLASAREAQALAAALGTILLEGLACELSDESDRALALYRSAGALGEIARLAGAHAVAPAPAPLSLSRREREVAQLVSSGRTNREIAETLALSERTVEHHVAAALGKLGFRTRSELAAFVATGG